MSSPRASTSRWSPCWVPATSCCAPWSGPSRTVDLHVRGNEFPCRVPSADVALVERLIDELLAVIDAGQPLNRDAVERSIAMLRAQTESAPPTC
jgi:hypothetical protein